MARRKKNRRNIFNTVAMPKVGSNMFDLSHDVKASLQMGWLTPIASFEAVPGDRFSLSVEHFIRFAPLVAPVMHRVNVTLHYWFVPNRIVWPQFGEWMGGEIDVTPPYFETTQAVDFEGKLGDYLGLPKLGTGVRVNALPFAAYAKIWEEWYRDQNLVASKYKVLNAGSNPDYLTYASQEPFRRSWMHDYFTSCLPFAQKGDEVKIPLIQGTTIDVQARPASGPTLVRDPNNGNLRGSTNIGTNTQGELQADGQPSYTDPNGNHFIQLDSEASSINTLRRAFRLQEWLERNARGGTRYVELIKSHFGVASPDARQARPEYIGGSKGSMVISEVLSTAQTEPTAGNVSNPVGQMAGHGVSMNGSKPMKYYATEHGWIIGLLNIQPITAYQQGLHRSLSRTQVEEYYWPSFANIGEQAVLKKEIYADQGAANNETFGYVPRYAEYKYQNNRVHGEMKTSLSQWQMGRQFSNAPLLNEQFIQCDTSEIENRIFAVPENTHKVYAHIYNNVKAVRKMPKFGVPTI